MQHFPDPLLRFDYDEDLKKAAKDYLQSFLESGSSAAAPFASEGAQPNPALVSAAMYIIMGASWAQPSDEQVKASVYHSRQGRQGGPSPEPPPTGRPPDRP